MDKGLVKHFDEPEMNLCLYGVLCIFGIQYNMYGKSSSSSLFSIPNEVRTEFQTSLVTSFYFVPSANRSDTRFVCSYVCPMQQSYIIIVDATFILLSKTLCLRLSNRHETRFIKLAHFKEGIVAYESDNSHSDHNKTIFGYGQICLACSSWKW